MQHYNYVNICEFFTSTCNIVVLTCNTTMSTYKVIMLHVAFDINKSHNNINIFHVDRYHAYSGQNYVTINFIFALTDFTSSVDYLPSLVKHGLCLGQLHRFGCIEKHQNPGCLWRLRRPINGSEAPEWLNIRMNKWQIIEKNIFGKRWWNEVILAEDDRKDWRGGVFLTKKSII